MRRVAVMLGLLAFLSGGGGIVSPNLAQAKDLQQLEYLGALLGSVVAPEKGTLRRYSLPQHVGSRGFRNGQLHPFYAEYELDSFETLLTTIHGLFGFFEIDMQVYPWGSPAITLTERRDAPDARTFRSRFQLALFEGRPESGFDAYSLWERPFLVEVHVFDEREVFPFLDLVRGFRQPGVRLDLTGEFSFAVSRDIDPEGREYLVIGFSPFLQVARNSAGLPRSSPWDEGGILRSSLDFLFGSPRFRKGVTPEGRDVPIPLWFQEIRATTDPDGTACWHMRGQALNPKAVTKFVREMQQSGFFRKVAIDSLTTASYSGTDLLVTQFRIIAKPDL